MNRRERVTLDTPVGGGAQPLDPADWDCKVLDDTNGQLTIVGRFHAGISVATRVHYQGRTFHVDQVRNLQGRSVMLQVTGHEVFA